MRGLNQVFSLNLYVCRYQVYENYQAPGKNEIIV